MTQRVFSAGLLSYPRWKNGMNNLKICIVSVDRPTSTCIGSIVVESCWTLVLNMEWGEGTAALTVWTCDLRMKMSQATQQWIYVWILPLRCFLLFKRKHLLASFWNKSWSIKMEACCFNIRHTTYKDSQVLIWEAPKKGYHEPWKL